MSSAQTTMSLEELSSIMNLKRQEAFDDEIQHPKKNGTESSSRRGERENGDSLPSPKGKRSSSLTLEEEVAQVLGTKISDVINSKDSSASSSSGRPRAPRTRSGATTGSDKALPRGSSSRKISDKSLTRGSSSRRINDKGMTRGDSVRKIKSTPPANSKPTRSSQESDTSDRRKLLEKRSSRRERSSKRRSLSRSRRSASASRRSRSANSRGDNSTTKRGTSASRRESNRASSNSNVSPKRNIQEADDTRSSMVSDEEPEADFEALWGEPDSPGAMDGLDTFMNGNQSNIELFSSNRGSLDQSQSAMSVPPLRSSRSIGSRGSDHSGSGDGAKRISKMEKIEQLRIKYERYKKQWVEATKEKKQLKKELNDSKLQVISLTKEVDTHMAEATVLRENLTEALQKIDNVTEEQRMEREKQNDLLKELNQERMDHKKSLDEIHAVKSELNKSTDALAEKDKRISSLKDTIERCEDKIDYLESKLCDADDYTKKLENEIAAFEDEILIYKEAASEAKSRVNGNSKSDLSDIDDTVQEKLDEAKERRLEEKRQKLERQLDEVHAEKLKLGDEAAKLKREKEKLEDEQIRLDDESDLLKKDKDELLEEKAKLSAELENLKQEKADMETRKQELTKWQNELEAQEAARVEETIKLNDAKVEEVQSKVRELEEENSTLQGKLKCEQLESNVKIKKKEEAIAALQKDVSNLRREIAERDADPMSIASLQEEVETAKLEANAAIDDLEEVQRRNRMQEEEIEELRSTNSNLLAEVRNLNKEVADWKKVTEDWKKQTEEWKRKTSEWTKKTYEWKEKAEAYQKRLESFDNDSDPGGNSNDGADPAPQSMFLQAAMERKKSVDNNASSAGGWGRLGVMFGKGAVGDENGNASRLEQLEMENEVQAETIKRLQSEIIKMQGRYKEEAYMMQKQVQKVEQEKEELTLKNTVLMKELELARQLERFSNQED